MKHSKRFNDAITALVKGYLSDTLAKGQCCACAVGNIIAYSMHYDIITRVNEYNYLSMDWTEDGISPHWGEVFCSTEPGKQEINAHRYESSIAKDQIDSTGYTWQELANVEFAFEKATNISIADYLNYSAELIDKDQLRGLYAVVDVLCEIEGITDVKEVKEFKEMFVKSN